MKRHNSSEDHDRECQNKVPREKDVNESSSSTTSTSVKGILRCRIAQKQAQQNKELASKAQNYSTLTSWASTLSSAGYFCEVRSIVDSDLLPLSAESTSPSSALIIEQSRTLQFSPSTGPFQPVRLVVYPHGQWRLDSPILEHRKIEDGRLNFPVESAELINLAHKMVFQTRVFFARAWSVLMVITCRKSWVYLPKNVCLLNGTSLYSKNCKIWHCPWQ